MELLICFFVHILMIVSLKQILKKSNTIKVKKVALAIFLVITPIPLWYPILGISKRK